MEQRLEGLEKSVAHFTELVSKLSTCVDMPPVRQNVSEDHNSLPTSPVPDMDDAMKANNAVASTFVQERFDPPKSLAQADTLNSTSHKSFDKAVSGILRTIRVDPPVHFSFTVESFSLMQQMEVEKYESEVFEVESGKWRLCLYPNGNSKGNGKGHISLSVELEKDNHSPSNNWHLDVKLKFFVQDKINSKYLVVQDGEIKRFDELNAEWGFDQFLSLEIFNSDSNGFLVNDCCTFGVEIFVLSKPTGECETLSMIKNPANGSLTWKITGFSKLDKPFYHSPEFTAGERSWTLKVYPRGYEEGRGNFLSVFLQLAEADKLPPKKKVGAMFKLRILNQNQEKTLETTQFAWFSYPDIELWGQRKFIRLGALHEMSKGFVVDDDTLTVEVEILCVSVSKTNMPSSAGNGILRTKRDAPPMHHSFTVESFSFLRKTKVDKYESEVFEVWNVKWRLCLYPNRNAKGDVKDYISLSLMLEKDNPFPKDWYLDVEFKLFVQDKINNKYLGVQDGQMKRFDMMKTEWCLDQFVSLETFNNASNGYLVDDCCTFGAEIVVIKNPNIIPSTILNRNSAMPNKPCSQVPGILRAKRDAPPVHYSFTVESFSLMQQMEIEKYESEVFEVESEKWRLCLYPSGNTKGNGEGYISLSLELKKDNPSPLDNWHLDVELKLFVQDKINNKYLVVQDGETKRFEKLITVWCLDQFLPIEIFKNDSNGYLANDCCTFGVEIFVIPNPTGICETLSMVKNPVNGSLTWKMKDFSKLDKPFYHSPEFTAGERSWKLKVYPRGYEEGRGNFLSVFLQLVEADKLPPKKKVGTQFKLRVLNQNEEKTLETTHTAWFSYHDNESWGQRKFMRLGVLHETSEGFVVEDDTLTVEVEILCVSVSKKRSADQNEPSSAGTVIQRTKRDDPPMHYSLTVESFSLLQETEVQYYESEIFKVEREKWRLCLYPNGNTQGNGKGHISLSVKMDKDNYPSNNWHLDVKLKLFVQDKINNNYLVVQDDETKRFDAMKTERGIDQFLSMDTFKDAANGYLVKDCCTFGVEIFVTESPTVKQELLSMVKQPAYGSFKWKLLNFSKLDDKFFDSPAFTAGERSWTLKVHPKGFVSGNRKFLSMYLELVDAEKLLPKKVWAEFKLRVINQHQAGENFEKKLVPDWGQHQYMQLEDLYDTSKGFVMDDTLTVEAEILCVSVSKVIF